MADDKFVAAQTKRVVEHNQVNIHLLRLTPLSTPPNVADLQNGDCWTDGTNLFIRLAGATKTVTVT